MKWVPVKPVNPDVNITATLADLSLSVRSHESGSLVGCVTLCIVEPTDNTVEYAIEHWPRKAIALLRAACDKAEERLNELEQE